MKQHEIKAELRTLYKDLEVLENGTEQEICDYFSIDPEDIKGVCDDLFAYTEKLEQQLAELEVEAEAEWHDWNDSDVEYRMECIGEALQGR